MEERTPVSKEASAHCTRPALPAGANAAPAEPAWIIADASPGPDQDQSRRSLAWTRTGAGSRPDSDRAHRTLRRDHEGGVARQPRPRARMVRQPGPQQRVAHWQPSGHERNDDLDRCARRWYLIRPCAFAVVSRCSPQLHVPPPRPLRTPWMCFVEPVLCPWATHADRCLRSVVAQSRPCLQATVGALPC